MRIAVTGSSGFIGSNLVKDLTQLGYRVICIDQGWQDAISVENPGFTAQCDFVFHLGANSDTRGTYEDYQKSNVIFSANLLWHCKHFKIPMVFASSGAVYGTNRKYASKPNPLTEYGASKLKTEELIREQYPGMAVALRYHNVYGSNEAHKGPMASIVWKYINGYLNGEKSHLLFDKSHKISRDFIEVSDVNKINLMFLRFYEKYENFPKFPPVFDVGTGQAETFKDLAEQIAKRTYLPIEYIKNPYNSKNYQFYTLANTRKIRNLYEMTYGEKFEPLSIDSGIEKVFYEMCSSL